LQKQKNEGIKHKRVGIQIIEQGICRRGHEIYDEKGEKIGYVTSGTFSPLLKYGIGMAYIQAASALEGNIVNVKIRNKLVKGKIASFPLYDSERFGYKRKPL